MWRDMFHRQRERIRAHRIVNASFRVALGIIGGVGLLCGIALIPYPGPGWLIVFAALGILASEFRWARRVRDVAVHHYSRWLQWLKRQGHATRAAVAAGAGLIVLVTLWLLGVLGMVSDWFGVDWEWLRSPALGC